MTKSSKKIRPKLTIGLDLGTAYLAIGALENGVYRPFESSIGGLQVPTIAYEDPNTGKWSFGHDAIMKSYNDTGDNLFMHVKRNLYERPHEKLYGGRYSAVEITAKLLSHARDLALSARPDLADYPQFGGNKRPAHELALVGSTPASWGIEPQTAYEESFKLSGFRAIYGFIAEPVAAARRVAHVGNIELKDGDRILTVDVGAGTTDITAIEYRRGVFHQLAAASGDAYLAGHDFTHAIAEDVAKVFRIPFKDVFGQGGLNLSNVRAKYRPRDMACVYAAEEAKRKLSVLEEVSVPVEFPKGRKTYSVTREHAAALWKPLIEQFTCCVAKSLDGTALGFEDITHFMLVGGSSRLPGLREAMAKAVGRDVSDIRVCTDSEHIVAAGAAEHAYYQDEASQALESGFGVTVLNPNTGDSRHLLLVEPGQIIPPDGSFVERSGFEIDRRGAKRVFVCRPFVCKTGVRATVVDGRDTFLADTETVPLEEIEADMTGFPEGEHAVAVGIKIDPNRRVRLLMRSVTRPDVEPLSVALSMRHANGERIISPGSFDILFLLDCSGSMAGAKLKMLKRAAKDFLTFAISQGANVGIVAFPDPLNGLDGKGRERREVSLLCPLTNSPEQLLSALDKLEARGGTPMHSALHESLRELAQREPSEQPLVILFTDGMPSEPDATIQAADTLKQQARLFTCGIGEDVLTPYLVSLASTPEDYFYAKVPEEILERVNEMIELVFRGQDRPQQALPAAAPTPAAPEVPQKDEHENDWDDLGLDDEEAA